MSFMILKARECKTDKEQLKIRNGNFIKDTEREF